MTVQPGSRIETKPRLRVVPDDGAIGAAILPAKYAPPRFPPDLVGVDRWQGALAQLAKREVALVQAPLGYGKTAWCAALFAEARAAGWRTAWLSVDTDDDGITAIDHLFAAMRFPHDGAEDTTAARGMMATALAQNIDADDRPYLLVIDDCDRLVDPLTLDILGRLLRHPPAQLRLVLSGRGRPAVPVDDAQRRGMTLSVSRADLALDDEATAAFLYAAGAASNPQDRAELCRMLEGWPGALRLVAHSYSGVAGLARRIDTLAAPLLDALPKSTQLFLQHCAVVPLWDAALCQRLSGERDSAEILRALADESLFLDPVPDSSAYRPHPAFLMLLKQRLDASAPEAAAPFHRSAARHFAAKGQVAEAIEQALLARDFDAATTWIADTAMPMIESGQMAAVAQWLRRLPNAKAAPGLARASAWLAMVRGDHDEGLPIADASEARALELLRQCHAMDRPDAAFEQCEQMLTAIGDLPDFAEDMLRATLAQSAVRRGLFGMVHDVVRPLLLRGAERPLGLVGALAVAAKASAARAQGQLGEAERLLREARDRQPAGVAAALVDAALARACYERDAFDEAAALAAAALPELEASLFQDGLIDAYMVAIRVASCSGQTSRAARLVDQAELIAFARNWAPLKAQCIVERARLQLPQTIDSEAVLCVSDEEMAVLDPLSAPARAFAILSEMRAYEAIAAGDRPRLTMVADRLLRLASNGDDAELRAAATLFNILPQLSGRCDKMVDLETVGFLNHAAKAGFRRTIVDVLDVTGVRAVQNFCSEAYASDCFLALLKLPEPSRRNPALEGAHRAAPGEAFSFLTEREIEILSALNAGESNKEIARTLLLAPETVKWHLKNVMRKLRANSREEAVANAGALGLRLIEKPALA